MDSRIESVLNFVENGERVADIGADHGYLSIELAKKSLATKIIATEKNIEPFGTLRKNVLDSGFENLIEVRLGDGLQVLAAGEVDTICIAGMGGALIKKILDDSPEIVKSAQKIIIQPMNAAKKIREWCAENNFIIEDEDLAESAGIIYEIICAVKFGEPKKFFKKDLSPLNRKFSMQRLEKLQKVLLEMSKSEKARSSEKFFTLRAEIDNLRKKTVCVN